MVDLTSTVATGSSAGIGASYCSQGRFGSASDFAATLSIHTAMHFDAEGGRSTAAEVDSVADIKANRSTQLPYFTFYWSPGCLNDSCWITCRSSGLDSVGSHCRFSYQGPPDL